MIKSIETSYAGCRFRSRLEARWAYFFDLMQIPWEYEPEGFELPSGRYLPDFWLPECDTWIEVKGDLSGLDLDRLHDAATLIPERPVVQTRGPRLMLLGPIPDPPATGELAWVGITGPGKADRAPYTFDDYYDTAFFHATNTVERFHAPCRCTHQLGHIRDILKPTVCPYYAGMANDAYRSARSARFEFGQTPQPPVHVS